MADEVPYGENITINLWVNGDNIGQVRDNGGSISHYYYLKDHLGDIKMVLNSSGGVDSYNDYYPYGEQMPNRNGTGSSDGRYKFTSKERDTETGLDYLTARYYDSWRGGFLSPDSMASDSTLAPWSPYQYSFDNPLRFEDPTGRWPDWATLGAQIGSWLTSKFSGIQNDLVNQMQPSNGSSINSAQAQAESDYKNSDLNMPTAKQMSKLKLDAVSNFTYAEGMGSVAGVTAVAGASLVAAAGPAVSLYVTDAAAGTQLYGDYKSGSGTENVLTTGAIGAGSALGGFPVGAGRTGGVLGASIYEKFVPTPQPLGF